MDSNFNLEKLAIGTAQFGLNYGISNESGKVQADAALSILDYAEASGVKIIDTASAYGDSESVLGGCAVSRFDIVTKLQSKNPIPNSYQWVIDGFHQSLQRLGVERLYALLIHNINDLKAADQGQVFKAVNDLKEAGKLKKFGVSIYDPADLLWVNDIHKIDIIQAPFNLVDRRILTNSDILAFKDRGGELHCRSAFMQGLLLMNTKVMPEYFSAWSYLWKARDEWVKNNGQDMLTTALQYSLSNTLIDKVIVGVDSFTQWQQIVNIASAKIVTTNWPSVESNDTNLINPSLWKL